MGFNIHQEERNHRQNLQKWQLEFKEKATVPVRKIEVEYKPKRRKKKW